MQPFLFVGPKELWTFNSSSQLPVTSPPVTDGASRQARASGNRVTEQKRSRRWRRQKTSPETYPGSDLGRDMRKHAVKLPKSQFLGLQVNCRSRSTLPT